LTCEAFPFGFVCLRLIGWRQFVFVQEVFIRAPAVLRTGSGVETLGKFNEKIIAVKQGNILATSFHPELTRDVSLHKQFVKMVKESKK